MKHTLSRREILAAGLVGGIGVGSLLGIHSPPLPTGLDWPRITDNPLLDKVRSDFAGSTLRSGWRAAIDYISIIEKGAKAFLLAEEQENRIRELLHLQPSVLEALDRLNRISEAGRTPIRVAIGINNMAAYAVMLQLQKFTAKRIVIDDTPSHGRDLLDAISRDSNPPHFAISGLAAYSFKLTTVGRLFRFWFPLNTESQAVFTKTGARPSRRYVIHAETCNDHWVRADARMKHDVDRRDQFDLTTWEDSIQPGENVLLASWAQHQLAARRKRENGKVDSDFTFRPVLDISNRVHWGILVREDLSSATKNVMQHNLVTGFIHAFIGIWEQLQADESYAESILRLDPDVRARATALLT